MWSGPYQYAITAKERRRSSQSPAYKIISLFHANEGYQQGRSNIRTDHAHQAILADCIRFGIQFSLDDFAVINGAGEMEYALACGDERGISNPSAYLALEKHWGRKPFLIAEPGTKTPTRVYVGRRFNWRGFNVECTSFSGESFVACAYKDSERTKWGRREVAKRFRITHAEILGLRKAQREAEKSA